LQSNFRVQFGLHSLVGDRIGTSTPSDPELFVLHGAGNATRDRYDALRQQLAEQRINSICFDFIGHGETGGQMSSSSLHSRTEQALAVIAKTSLQPPLKILGASMGAYNAIKLTEHHEVETLVLVVPGIYTPTAYEIPFGPRFSEIIRRDKSWQDSDAWEILSRFEGSLLLITAGHDKIIPAEIPQRLMEVAVKAKRTELLCLEDAPHTVAMYLQKNKNALKVVTESIKSFLEPVT